MANETVKTTKGTTLPLINLKGKQYLQVAYRIQWFSEDVPTFSVNTELVQNSETHSLVKATIQVLNTEGRVVRTATAHKREDSKGFPDHLEKAETGAVGRALILLGYGTQFALADLDEGARLADSPLPSTKPTSGLVTTTAVATTAGLNSVLTKPTIKTTSSFKPAALGGGGKQ